jgi:hypothetical protein
MDLSFVFQPFLDIDSSVGILMGYMLDSHGSIPGMEKRFFSMTQCADWLWGSPTLLSNGYWGLICQG